jgi:rare lipoprotein A (peptidoglycan hydrolase)
MLVLVAATLAAAPAHAHDVDRLVRKSGDLPEVRRLVALHDELDAMLARYAALEAEAGRTRLHSAQAARAAEDAARAAEEAKARLDDRVRSAYELGPAAPLEAMLGASSFADLALVSEYASRVVSIGEAALRDSLVAQVILSSHRAAAEAARQALEPRLERLRSMLRTMQAKVRRATRIARDAHLEAVTRAQQEQVAAAVARAGSWDLGVIDYGQDQSHLLALLGPTGGQTCDTPDGLVETGQSFEGYASWYGWEFGGQPTATGAIFDPRLFTAANRWLPFGTFLRVRYGDRCAIVLINDRGPYGRLERVIDLSQASAAYLGVGVSWVRAEILVPASGLPAQ